jgi:hypothetical protein
VFDQFILPVDISKGSLIIGPTLSPKRLILERSNTWLYRNPLANQKSSSA